MFVTFQFPSMSQKNPHLLLFNWPFESSLWVVMIEPVLTAIMKEHKLQSPVVNQTLNCIAVYLNSSGNLPYFQFIYSCSPCYGGAISKLTKPLVTDGVGNSWGYPV